MSLVSEITEAIESRVQSIVPLYRLSQYIWDTTLNANSKSIRFFAVRPGSASFVSGTCRTITIEQSFALEIGSSYKNKGDNDSDANDVILALYQSHEDIYRQLMRDNFNIGKVQVVGGLDISEPEVDNDNKVCRIIATYTIRYRTE